MSEQTYTTQEFAALGVSMRELEKFTLTADGKVAIRVVGGSAGDMLKSDNLSGLGSNETARANIEVYSITEVDNGFAAIDHNHDADYASISHNHDAQYAAISHTHTFASLTSKPTTIGGYGISDAMTANDIANAIEAAKTAVKNDITGGAAAAYDTLLELQNELQSNDTDISSIISTQSTKMDKVTGQTGSLTRFLANGNIEATSLVANDIPNLAISKISTLQSTLDGKANLSGATFTGNVVVDGNIDFQSLSANGKNIIDIGASTGFVSIQAHYGDDTRYGRFEVRNNSGGRGFYMGYGNGSTEAGVVGSDITTFTFEGCDVRQKNGDFIHGTNNWTSEWQDYTANFGGSDDTTKEGISRYQIVGRTVHFSCTIKITNKGSMSGIIYLQAPAAAHYIGYNRPLPGYIANEAESVSNNKIGEPVIYNTTMMFTKKRDNGYSGSYVTWEDMTAPFVICIQGSYERT